MLEMTVHSVGCESDKFWVHLTPVKCTSYEVFTSYEVHGRIDTSRGGLKQISVYVTGRVYLKKYILEGVYWYK